MRVAISLMINITINVSRKLFLSCYQFTLLEARILADYPWQSKTSTCQPSLSPPYHVFICRIPLEWRTRRSLYLCCHILPSGPLWARLRIRELNRIINTWVRRELGLESSYGFISVGHLEVDGRGHQQIRLNIYDIVRLWLSSLNCHPVAPSSAFLSHNNKVKGSFSRFHRLEEELKLKSIVGMIEALLGTIHNEEFINERSIIIGNILKLIWVDIILLEVFDPFKCNLNIFRCRCSALSG